MLFPYSCNPNAETQKWTVNGLLRIGFFTKRRIAKGEEITFDYKYERYGKVAQKCYCGSENCRGLLGGEADAADEEEEEEVCLHFVISGPGQKLVKSNFTKCL